MKFFSQFQCALAILCVLVVSVGCGGDGMSEFKGKVTWNGEPIPDGKIGIIPIDGEGQIVEAPIINGEFMCRTQPGAKKVSITANRKVGETKPTERIPNPEPIYHQYIPAEFNSATELKAMFNSGEPVEIAIDGTEMKHQGMSAQDKARYQKQGGGL